MKKEEILEASRKENNKKDFLFLEVRSKGNKIAGMGTMILAWIYLWYEKRY